jgi:hypothetical protein
MPHAYRLTPHLFFVCLRVLRVFVVRCRSGKLPRIRRCQTVMPTRNPRPPLEHPPIDDPPPVQEPPQENPPVRPPGNPRPIDEPPGRKDR